jgi:hypothetical protein
MLLLALNVALDVHLARMALNVALNVALDMQLCIIALTLVTMNHVVPGSAMSSFAALQEVQSNCTLKIIADARAMTFDDTERVQMSWTI